ncbi:hypothetical protein CK216_05705 [Mesorhizobium sp. WSM3876]|nr:hypothetical protein CK216_05705 [Mesorhizobium sp. WSM3876]
MHVVRDGVPVFKRDRKLSAWAGEDWTDTQTSVARRKTYVPFMSGEPVSEASTALDEESTVHD